ncbi:MAG TPA: serine/threonine protein phosphatase [Spongiibacteraceae bacterium]|nr:serine/threonine protein phosphatase [Spongiibacteraceae bacterium]HCS28493.1 serine/threonine protein phosphatase [Spongiibacteraceae bacterium]
MLSYAAKSDIGCHRSNNEDNFAACPELNLWVLADGVGGQDAGEVASEITCRVIQRELQAGASLEDAIHIAHDAVLEAPAEGVGRPGMASTVVALLVHGNSYQVSWVGDSRCYVWSREQGLDQVSRDHSLIQQLLEEQHINEEEAATHPGRNIVLQAIGQEKLQYLHVDSITDGFEDGQIILLCSDGLSDYVKHEDIAAILESSDDLSAVSDQLIAKTLANDGADNVTVVLVRLEHRSVNDTQARVSTQASSSGAVLAGWRPVAVVAAVVALAALFYCLV